MRNGQLDAKAFDRCLPPCSLKNIFINGCYNTDNEICKVLVLGFLIFLLVLEHSKELLQYLPVDFSSHRRYVTLYKKRW